MQMIPKVTRDCRVWYSREVPEGIFVPSPHESYGDVVIALSRDKRSCLVCLVKPESCSGNEYTGQGCYPEEEIKRFIQWYLKENYLLALQAGRQENPFYKKVFELLHQGPVNWGWGEVDELQSYSPAEQAFALWFKD